MRIENPSPNLGPSTAHQDMEITVGNVTYLLILNAEVSPLPFCLPLLFKEHGPRACFTSCCLSPWPFSPNRASSRAAQSLPCAH